MTQEAEAMTEQKGGAREDTTAARAVSSDSAPEAKTARERIHRAARAHGDGRDSEGGDAAKAADQGRVPERGPAHAATVETEQASECHCKRARPATPRTQSGQRARPPPWQAKRKHDLTEHRGPAQS